MSEKAGGPREPGMKTPPPSAFERTAADDPGHSPWRDELHDEQMGRPDAVLRSAERRCRDLAKRLVDAWMDHSIPASRIVSLGRTIQTIASASMKKIPWVELPIDEVVYVRRIQELGEALGRGDEDQRRTTLAHLAQATDDLAGYMEHVTGR